MSLTTLRRPCIHCLDTLPRRGFTSTPISRSPTWPWRRSPSSSPEWIREERRIYARPSSLKPKLLWVVIGIWTPLCFFVADNIRYSSERSLPSSSSTTSSTTSSLPTPASPTTSSSSMSEAISATLDPLLATQSTKDSLIAGILVTAGLILPTLALGFPTRVVTKMTQVRMRPASSSLSSTTAVGVGKEVKKKASDFTEFVEFETLSTQMWRGPWGRPRLIPKEDVKVVRTLRGGDINRVPWLKLAVSSSPPNSSFLDRWSYRINFTQVRDTDYRIPEGKDEELPEVVVSVARLEEVFGKL